MLHQNWFMNPRFEMFEDYGESQSFYDTETKNIYVVSEEYGQKGSTIVQEITPESFEYAPNIARYNKWKNKEYVVSVSAIIEVPITAKSPKEAREKVEKTLGEYYNQAFVYAYLSEVEQVTDENGNECK